MSVPWLGTSSSTYSPAWQYPADAISSPPPPPRFLTPPPPDIFGMHASYNPPSSKPSGSTSRTNVVGSSVGVVVIVLILCAFCRYCIKKTKRKMRAPANRPTPSHHLLPLEVNPNGGHPSLWQQNPNDSGSNHPARFSKSAFTYEELRIANGGQPSLWQQNLNDSGSNHPGRFSKSTFTYEELRIATDGFSDANLLGSGGFGYVHKGVLPDGKEVAVKKLKAESRQGEREFHAEVEVISRVHHKHLVSLVGYCISASQRLLVYEFVPNNTLEFHLHGRDGHVLDWSFRLRIALGSAKGLAYLHEDCHPKTIHRDIKAANILLDFNFDAKVADFGLAKITSEDNTHVSTRVMGTFGYLAPEYANTGKITDRSDVFSYGVMLLELITGRRPVDSRSNTNESLVVWARPLLTKALDSGIYDSLVDERLEKKYNSSEMKRMITIAAACVRQSAGLRPKMSQIVRALEGDVSLEDLNEGVRPGHSGAYGSTTDYDSGQYNRDMQKFKKMALASGTYASSEYSVPATEYGPNLPALSS